MNKLVQQFNLRLDQLLGTGPGQYEIAFTDPPVRAALITSSALKELDMTDELVPNPDLRSRWQLGVNAQKPKPARPAPALRLAWGFAALLVALGLLALFRQPVFAAIGPWFGYIYQPETGFLPVDSTRALGQPVRQEHAGESLTVMRGLGTPTETRIWLEYSNTAHPAPADGATLTTESGVELPLVEWQSIPDEPGSRSISLVFPPLPEGTIVTTLALPEGWQLPLAWIPSTSAGLPDVRVEPYPEK